MEQIFSLRGKRLAMDEGTFNRLSLADRANFVWEKGAFVDSILFNNYLLMLYSINRQFAELCYDIKSGTIIWISLANEYDLAKYLDSIDIAV